MAEGVFNRLSNSWLVKWFKSQTTPRWIILLIDLFIVTASYAIVEMKDIYGDPQSYSIGYLATCWAAILSVYFVVIYLSKSYTCVIRLSVIEDLYRTFMVVCASTCVLIVLNLVCYFATSGVRHYGFWNLFVIAIETFSIMMIERLFIKYFYMRITAASNTSRKRVLVLGTSLNSLILANALKNEINGKFEPVGLLSTKTTPGVTEVNGFKIYYYDPETVANLFVEHGIYALIFNDSRREVMRNGMADVFIDNNIALLALNRVEEFELDDDKDKGNISTFVKEVEIEDLLGREPIVLNNSLVSTNVRGTCVLITGACGSIGSEIVRQLATYQASRIVLVDQAETPMHDLALEMKRNFPDAEVVLFMGDVQNRERMEVAFEKYKPKFVFHAAAYKHVPMMEINPTEAILTNVMGTRNVADLALKHGAYKFVMVSTDKAVNPTNIMGCTKRLAEIYCQSLFFNAAKRGMTTQFITTRFGNVLGSNGSVIPLFRKQIERGGPVTVTHKDIIRYFMTIPEACSLVLEAGCMGSGGEIYIFDMGSPVKIYDLAVRMISLAGFKPNVDIKIEEVGLRPGEKLYEELLNDKEKTTATVNKKIMIAKVRTYDYRTVCENIELIIDNALTGNVHDMVYAMKKFVPEYKSNQSEEFERIDREIAEQKLQETENTPETEKYY
ncbi:polysaccharide biosynthesis protein [Sodaliphilus sp.]|uniref:polysaccharide biosynthesis protein n=1 Tax=Sodaliphilus sp. TaxID=2815818 RepID=UPI00388FA0E3